MQGDRFQPSTVSVKVGETVTWRNEDGVIHNVTSREPGGPRSPTIPYQGTYTFTPQRAGTFPYVCTIHPGMEGTLTVTK
jgi:plastocyanin